jgi:hypothetical protein
MGPIRCPGTPVTNSKPSCVTSLKSEDVAKLNRQGKWLHTKRRTGVCRKYRSELACWLGLMGRWEENNLMCLQSFVWEIRQCLCGFLCTFQTHYHCQVMVQSDNCCVFVLWIFLIATWLLHLWQTVRRLLKAAFNVATVVGKFSRTRKRQKNKNFIVSRFERLLLSYVSCDLTVRDKWPPFWKGISRRGS